MNTYTVKITGDARSMMPPHFLSTVEETRLSASTAEDLEQVIRALVAGYQAGMNLHLPLEDFVLKLDENGNGAGSVRSDNWEIPFQVTRVVPAEPESETV